MARGGSIGVAPFDFDTSYPPNHLCRSHKRGIDHARTLPQASLTTCYHLGEYHPPALDSPRAGQQEA